MTLPSSNVLGVTVGLSELFILLRKRSKSTVRNSDAGSLRYLWIAIVASLFAAGCVAPIFPGAALPAFFYPVGFAALVAGLILRWTSILYLGRYFTVNVAIHRDHKIIDSGPYRLIRHPSYTGALLSLLGLALCFLNAVSFLVAAIPIVCAFLHRISVEESALCAEFGNGYVRYRLHTKRLIPYLY